MQHQAISAFTAALPILATPVHAGFPSPATDYVEDEIDLQRLLVKNRPSTFIVKVAGDSMIGAQLFDGDLAVVDRALDPAHGDIVVVDIDGERSFKLWLVESGGPRLDYANPRLPRLELDAAAHVEVWGVVSGSVNPRRRARS